jgi:transcriptional regulator with XRE-family HTH domain
MPVQPKDIIQYLISKLGWSHSKIAALIGVSENTVVSWHEGRSQDTSAPIQSERANRLKALYGVVFQLRLFFIDDRLITSILHEPISESNPRSLIDYIVKEPKNSLLETAAQYIGSTSLKDS